MDEPRRNDAFDRELRRALAAGGGAAPGPHVDAEAAAAWMDRRLDAGTARTIETHLAGCGDCQAMIATLARMTPDQPVVADGITWWRRLRAGWVVPATVAAAAALVIWVAVPQQRAANPPAEQLQARVDRGPATPPAAPQPAPADASAPAPAAAEPEAKAERRRAPEADAFNELRKQEAEAAAPALERRERFADAAAPAAPPAAPPPPPAAAPRPPESLQETVTVDALRPSPDAQQSKSVTVTGESPARSNERQDAAAGATQQSLRSALGDVAGGRAANPLVVAAPDGARWRRTGTVFEFAPRADAPFSAVSLPVAADAINAGASPGGVVCWLAGNGGLVLVSSDGVRFTRTSAPAAVNLIAITAANARGATVTAADGRRFRTTDGGVNWTPLP